MKSRAETLWDQVRQFIVPDVRAAVRDQVDDLQDGLQKVRAAGQGLATRTAAIETVVPTLALKQHTHAPGDVNGLVAATASVNARLVALETAVAAIKQKVGL